VTRGSNDKLMTSLRSSTAAESACSRAAKLGDYLSARWLMKVHHSLATYHGAADMNKRCAMWLPSFLQRGIHFFGERTEVLALNNFVLFDRVHLPMIGKRAAVVEEDLLSVREPVRARTGTHIVCLCHLQPAALLKVDDLENCDREHEKKATDISQWMIQLRHV
jgi:hypothetical protein